MCPEFPFSHASVSEQRTTTLHLVCPQGYVARMLEHYLLSLAAQDEAKELVQRGIERLPGRLVGVEENEPAERIGGECDVLVCGCLRRIARFLDHRNHLHA